MRLIHRQQMLILVENAFRERHHCFFRHFPKVIQQSAWLIGRSWQHTALFGIENFATEHALTPNFTTDRGEALAQKIDRKSTRLNSSHVKISYAVFCLKKKKKQ